MADDDSTTTTIDVAGSDGDTPAEPTQERTFTQEDLERHISERLKRERQKYQDYADLKRKAEELDKIKESELSEVEKLQKQLEDAQRKAQDAEKTALATLKKSSILSEASKLNFIDPDDAYALLAGKDFEIEAGEVKGVSEAVANLAESKPHLIKNSQAARLESFNPAGQTKNAENDAQRLARLYKTMQGDSPLGG